jgi:hypothetical protein
MSDTAEKESKQLIPIGDRGIELRTFDELFRFSQFVVKSGFAPRGIDSPEKAFLALQMGLEVGLSPMASLQNIGVINGRPGFYGDVVIAMIQADPQFQDMTVEYSGADDDLTCTVNIMRKGRSPSWGSFSVREAKKADLIGNPSKKDTWGKYERKMLFWRAFGTAKLAFSDKLKGFRTTEELGDIEPEKPAKIYEIKKPEFKETEKPASKEKALEELAKAKEAVHNATPDEPKKEDPEKGVEQPSLTIVKESAVEFLKAKISEANLTVTAVLKVLHTNHIGLNVQMIDELSENDAQLALDNWIPLEQAALKATI